MTIKLHGGPAVRYDTAHLGPSGSPKRGHETKRAARTASAIASSRFDREFHVYRCGTCLLWHLASGPRRRLEA